MENGKKDRVIVEKKGHLLTDLQDHLFEMLEKLNNDFLEGEKLDQEIKRIASMTEVAKVAVTNAALMVKCADSLYGIPVNDLVPLIPKAETEETFIVSKQRDKLTPLINYKRQA
jgi:hypothetical protein